MISEKFVKIAREVIIHVRRGNKLRRGSLLSNTTTTCPLGVICLNNGKDINLYQNDSVSTATISLPLYSFAHTYTGTDDDFELGFDESVFFSKVEGTESYNIGWALGKQCDKRGWIE